MKTNSILLVLIIFSFISCDFNKQQEVKSNKSQDEVITGKWVRISQTGPIAIEFKEKGMVDVDFGNDGSVDLVSKYLISGDTIKFTDTEGNMCPEVGMYKIDQTDYYLAYDLIKDDCGGRIKSTMGFWTKPDPKALVAKISDEITKSPSQELLLNRARVFLAIGLLDKAKADFDVYLATDSTSARVFLNRAGTQFMSDLQGVVDDCNSAIAIDPNSKNAYFLRGLARYNLGDQEGGCEDFNKAIELGFSVLRIAEQEKCVEYWSEK